jgi:hypothetical protein
MSLTKFVAIAAILLALAALSATPSLAAKGGKGKPGTAGSTGSSITLNQVDPHLGGDVTFTVAYPGQVKDPRIAVRCYQDGVMTYAEAGTYDHVFLLGGGWSVWLERGGPADCTAELFYIVWHGNNTQEVFSLAWTSFQAGG